MLKKVSHNQFLYTIPLYIAQESIPANC